MEICNTTCECCTGCILVLLNVVNVISHFSDCYSMNGHRYCFFTDDSVLSWDKAREFCEIRNLTLPIITDAYTENAFQKFNNVTLDASNAEHINISGVEVWLDAHASNDSDRDNWHWHWIGVNGQHSGKY